MKYLKTFESIINSIWNIEKFKKVWGFEPEDFEDYFVEMVDDLNLDAKVSWYTIGNHSLELKIKVPVEGNSDLHGWFNENIKPRLERIKSILKNKYGIQYSGYQVGLTYSEGDQSFYYKLIWYKTSLLPLSKRNESFEVVMPKGTNEIIGNYGLVMEDIEDLFLEFHDMGFDIRIMPSLGINIGNESEKTGLIVDVIGEKDSFEASPELSLLVRRVVRQSTELGLYLVESPNRMNNFRQRGKWTGCIRFTFKKR